MRKTLFFLFAFLGTLLVAQPVEAFVSSEIIDNLSYQELKVYNRDFDILVLDFVLPDNHGVADVLQALTVNNTREANNSDIDKVILWQDDGDDIWQGLGVDVKLAEGNRVDYRNWIFVGLDQVIPVGGLHLYVSVETKETITSERKMQFALDELSDVNADGSYNSGDQGVFVDSDNDGPINAGLVSDYVYTLENRTVDILAPKINLTNLKAGGSYNLTDPFVIEGVAKDRMQGSPQFVRASIAPSGDPVNWQDVTATTTDFLTWSFSVSGLAAGDYDVQIKASDWDYNEVVSGVTTITLVALAAEEPEVVEPETTEPENQTPAVDQGEWAGRLVKTDSSPRVYLVKDNVRYWFYNEAIFYQYYDDFSTVELISDEEMSGYVEGKDMPMKAGQLVKRIISNKVYETGDGWKIRWIKTETEATSLYGADWDKKINLIPDRYFNMYEEVENL